MRDQSRLTLDVTCLWVGAITVCVLAYCESRTPGTIDPFLLLLVNLVLLLILGFSAIRLIAMWHRCPLHALLAICACCVAPFAGSHFGSAARDRRFFEWRLPLYERVVERARRTATLPGVDEEPLNVELVGDEAEAAHGAQAWLDSRGELVVEFWWANRGPLRQQFTYTYFSSGTPDAPGILLERFRHLAGCWYEGWKN